MNEIKDKEGRLFCMILFLDLILIEVIISFEVMVDIFLMVMCLIFVDGEEFLKLFVYVVFLYDMG